MVYHSEGDSSDIFDQDFNHPQEDSVWSSKITTELRDDEIVWIKETRGYLGRSTDLVLQEFSPYLRHPFLVEKKHDWFSTTLRVNQWFIGRGVYQKYPQIMAENAEKDSALWLPEAMWYIFSAALQFVENDSSMTLASGLSDRLNTHLRNYFAYADIADLTGQLNSDRAEFLTQILNPFMSQLPEKFIPSLIQAMKPLELELQITQGLQNDEFRYQLILPGNLISTNADTINGDTLQWSFNLEDFVNDDYLISAESVMFSVKRIQITVIAAVLGFLILLGIIYKIKT